MGRSPQITPHPDSQGTGGGSPRCGPASAVGSGCHCSVAKWTILSLSLANCPPPTAAANSHCEVAGDEWGARLGRRQVYPQEVRSGDPAPDEAGSRRGLRKARTRAQVPLRPTRSPAPPPQLLGMWRHLRAGRARPGGSGRGGAPRADTSAAAAAAATTTTPSEPERLGHRARWWTTACGTTSRCLTMKTRRTPTSTRPVSSAGGTR